VSQPRSRFLEKFRSDEPVNRPRSIRPRKAPRSQQLNAVLRMLGTPEPGLLDAALEPADAQAIQDQANAEAPDALLATAISVCLEAHETWQRLGAAQRAQVRGFTLQLLALGADQALRLERAILEHGTLSAEHAMAVQRLAELVPRGALLCGQAADVLERVAGEAAPRDDEPPLVANATFALAQRLHRLAHAGQELLRSANGTVRKRAMLYGLNDSFLDGLAAAGAELVRVNDKASDTTSLDESRRVLDQARRATFLLAGQISDAFAAAHRIDAQIPVLPSAATKTRTPDRDVARPSVREAHVVVLNVDEPKYRPQVGPYARPAPRVVLPAPAPRVLDANELDASGVIRKRSRPPQR
jgi:hypothetical protein